LQKGGKQMNVKEIFSRLLTLATKEGDLEAVRLIRFILVNEENKELRIPSLLEEISIAYNG
jgi:hypothetical protein